MELRFPIEFIVRGTPVSAQAARAATKTRWMEEVRAASRAVLPEHHLASGGRIAVTLFYFPTEPMRGDIDNIVKLVLDALCRHIYLDDAQVERLVVQKFEPGNPFDFVLPSPTLERSRRLPGPALYVHLSDDPFEDLT